MTDAHLARSLKVTQKIYVDPPSGWKYGFPMVWDKESEPDMHVWLVQNGYPQKEIDRMGEHFYVRCWNAESNE